MIQFYILLVQLYSLIFYINHDLQSLSEWLEDNNLVLGVSKTKCVLFTSQRHEQRDCIFNLNLLGKSLSCKTSQFKYLGVVFDNFDLAGSCGLCV